MCRKMAHSSDLSLYYVTKTKGKYLSAGQEFHSEDCIIFWPPAGQFCANEQKAKEALLFCQSEPTDPQFVYSLYRVCDPEIEEVKVCLEEAS